VCGFAFPDTGREWQAILALYQIRNRVAHNYGKAPDENEEGYKEILNCMKYYDESIRLDGIGKFEFTEDAMRGIVGSLTDFLRSLGEIIQ